jgi:hypothetical protein
MTVPTRGRKGAVVVTIKLPLLVPEPDRVITVIGPVDAPLGTFTTSCEAFITKTEFACTPLKKTLVESATKFTPDTVTSVPTGPV